VPNYILAAQTDSSDELLCISDSRAQIEQLMSAIANRVGVQVRPSAHPPTDVIPAKTGMTAEVIEQAKSFKQSGALIDAIKLIRDHSDMGLREAKEYVERL
jgi:ribosomal protein L7/L12